MSLVPDDLKNEWKDKALLLNDSDGGLGVKCTLIFEGGIESTSNVAADSIGAKPRVGLSFGGRSSARTITGQENTDDKAESARMAAANIAVNSAPTVINKGGNTKHIQVFSNPKVASQASFAGGF